MFFGSKAPVFHNLGIPLMDPLDLQKLQHYDSLLQGLASGQCSPEEAEDLLKNFQALLDRACRLEVKTRFCFILRSLKLCFWWFFMIVMFQNTLKQKIQTHQVGSLKPLETIFLFVLPSLGFEVPVSSPQLETWVSRARAHRQALEASKGGALRQDLLSASRKRTLLEMGFWVSNGFQEERGDLEIFMRCMDLVFGCCWIKTSPNK